MLLKRDDVDFHSRSDDNMACDKFASAITLHPVLSLNEELTCADDSEHLDNQSHPTDAMILLIERAKAIGGSPRFSKVTS